MSSQNTQESNKNIRHSLKTLQPVAQDKENLTGRTIIPTGGKDMARQVKIEIKDKVTDTKRKKTSHMDDKCIQAGEDGEISIDDLTSEEPSENYWKKLAEKRQVALHEALLENRELHEKIEKLEEENRICNKLLEETKSLVEILTEIADDSGINMTESNMSTSSALEDAGDD